MGKTEPPDYISMFYSANVPGITYKIIVGFLCPPFKKECKYLKVPPRGYAEWWCHSKPHCAGHLLHFDQSDDAQTPLVSTVLYLSEEGVGGPTLVTEQAMVDKHIAPQGWLCKPKENRLLLFRGSLLHGVVPGAGLPRCGTLGGN